MNNLERKLYKAINAGQKEDVARLIDEGAELNITRHYMNPMQRAVFNDDVTILRLLLNGGANLNLTLEDDGGILHEAIERKKNKSIQFLLESGADIHQCSEPNKITPLHIACRFNKIENNKVIELLLEKGADINAKTILGSTPLHYLCEGSNYNNIDNESLLIEQGADVNAKDEFGITPLHVAVLNQNSNLIEFLISKGSNVNSIDIYGETPLSFAKNKKLDIITQLLLKAGAKNIEKEKNQITGIDDYKKSLWLPVSLKDCRGELLETVQPFIKIRKQTDADLKPWQSKFGGHPYLPKSAEFPHDSDGKALFFLAQINFSDLPTLSPFPEKGILQFYIPGNYIEGRPHDDDKTKQDMFRVLYYKDVKTDKNKLITDFSFLPEYEDYATPLDKPFSLSFSIDYAPLSPTDFHFNEKFENLNIHVAFNNSFREQERIFKSRCHKIGGYPGFTQDDPRYDVVDKKDDQNKNTLLFQMDTDSNICWGDGGNASFFINENDLKNLDFTNVLYDWSGG